MTPELVRAQWLRVVVGFDEPLYVRLELADYLRAKNDEYLRGLAADLEDPAPRRSRQERQWN